MPARYYLNMDVGIAFTNGLFHGLFLITACFANRWLFFTDEGWVFRKRIHWLMAVVTNLILVLTIAGFGSSVYTPTARVASVEEGHHVQEFVIPGWDTIVEVRSNIYQQERKSEPT